MGWPSLGRGKARRNRNLIGQGAYRAESRAVIGCLEAHPVLLGKLTFIK